MMYESVDVVGLNPSPNPFLMMDYYNQSRGCLIPEKGLVPGAPHPYSTSIRNQHWNGSNHCRWYFHCLVNFILLIGRLLSWRKPLLAESVCLFFGGKCSRVLTDQSAWATVLFCFTERQFSKFKQIYQDTFWCFFRCIMILLDALNWCNFVL